MEPGTLIVFGMLAVLLALMFRSQRKRQRQFQQLQGSLEVGRDIITTAGLHAKVVELDEKTATLETAPGQLSRWDRRAIATVLPTDTDPGDLEHQDVGSDEDSQGTPPDGLSVDRPDDEK